MDPAWEAEFRNRMHSFELERPPRQDEVAVSIKVRVSYGCFHREHSPEAYRLIDEHLASVPASERSEFSWLEHESGPELLVYLALTTAGVTLAKSVIDLITAVLKARSKGVERGDRPKDPLEIIVRRVAAREKFEEVIVLRINHGESVDQKAIKSVVEAALQRLIETADDTTANQAPAPDGSRRR